MKLYLTLTALLLSICAYAQPGVLDPGFNGNGKLLYELSGFSLGPFSTAIQADGKIVSQANISGSNYNASVVVRHLPNGALDLSFGNNGIVYLDTGALKVSYIYDVAITPSGKIVLCGSRGFGSQGRMCVYQLNSNGTVDNSFGTNGYSVIPLTTISFALSMQVDSAGKITIAGNSQNYYAVAVARLNVDGSPDLSFATNGILELPLLPGGYAYAYGIKRQGDGKYLISAVSTDTAYNKDRGALIRLNNNGSADNSFGNSGIAYYADTTAFIAFYNAAMQSDGKIVVCGTRDAGVSSSLIALRYHVNGTLDQAFGNSGHYALNYPTALSSRGYDVALQSDGKIILAGSVETAASDDMLVVRLNDNGTNDNSFDGDGILQIDFADASEAFKVHILPNKKILLTGGADKSFYNIAMVRIYSGLESGIQDQADEDMLVTVYPNPAQEMTYICMELSEATEVSVDLLSIDGRWLSSIVQEVKMNAGKQVFPVNMKELPAGQYLIRVSSRSGTKLMKMTRE